MISMDFSFKGEWGSSKPSFDMAIDPGQNMFSQHFLGKNTGQCTPRTAYFLESTYGHV